MEFLKSIPILIAVLHICREIDEYGIIIQYFNFLLTLSFSTLNNF